MAAKTLTLRHVIIEGYRDEAFTDSAEAEKFQRLRPALAGRPILNVETTYRIGQRVEVYSFGRWRRGEVVGLGRTQVKVDYARNAKGTRHVKSFPAPWVRPA